MPQASIDDPASVAAARRAVLRFGATAEAGLGGVVAALHRVRDRLRLEHLPGWKRQLVKRQEALSEARREFLNAEDEVRRARSQVGARGGIGKASSDDERKALRKAEARVAEAEEQIKAVQRWLISLDDDGDALAHACSNHALDLHTQVEAFAARLASAEEALAAYHAARTTPAPQGTSHA